MHVLQLNTNRTVSYLWSPRRGVNPAWRLCSEPSVIPFPRERVPDPVRVACYDDLIDMMVDDYLNTNMLFGEIYDKYFPHGPRSGGVNRMTHMINLFSEVERRIFKETEEVM